MTDSQFVTNIYSSLLLRSAKDEEVRHWTDMLASGMSRSDVVEAFMSSSEFINLQTQKERYRVSFPGPVNAPRAEQEVISVLQNHVVRRRSAAYAVQLSTAGAESVRIEPLHLEDAVLAEELPDRNLSSEMTAISAGVRQAKQEVGQLNPRVPGLISHFVQSFKRAMQRSLLWYTRSQQNFNEQVTKAVDEHGNSLVAMEQSLRHSHNQLQQHLREFATRLNGEIVRLEREVTKLQTDHLERLIRETELANQEHFSSYLDFFQEASPVLDLGCGRGEFLALLKDSGITSYGVDVDEDACNTARRKSLQVIHDDLFELLRELPDRSLGGIFSARVIEFVPPHQQMNLIGLCSEKLKAGGVLVIETTNPDSRRGYGRISGLDETHFRPVGPELMKSAFESNDFREVKIMFPGCVQASSASPADQAGSNGAGIAESMAASFDRLKAGPVYAVLGRRS